MSLIEERNKDKPTAEQCFPGKRDGVYLPVFHETDFLLKNDPEKVTSYFELPKNFFEKLETFDPMYFRVGAASHTILWGKSAYIAVGKQCFTVANWRTDDLNDHVIQLACPRPMPDVEKWIRCFLAKLEVKGKYQFEIYNITDLNDNVAPLSICLSIWSTVQSFEQNIHDAGFSLFRDAMDRTLISSGIHIFGKDAAVAAAYEGSTEYIHFVPNVTDEANKKYVRVPTDEVLKGRSLIYIRSNQTQNGCIFDQASEDYLWKMLRRIVTSSEPYDLIAPQITDFSKHRIKNRKIRGVAKNWEDCLDKSLSVLKNGFDWQHEFEIQQNGALIFFKQMFWEDERTDLLLTSCIAKYAEPGLESLSYFRFSPGAKVSISHTTFKGLPYIEITSNVMVPRNNEEEEK